MPLLFVIGEGAGVLAPVAVDKHTLAIHLVFSELSIVHTSIGPCVDPVTFHFVVNKVAFVVGTVEHREFALAVAEPVDVLPFKVAIVPLLLTEAVLLIHRPFSVVGCLVGANQLALATLQIFLPVALVVAAIRVNHASQPLELVVDPVTVVAHSVWPDLRALTMSLLLVPLPRVNGVVFYFHVVAPLHLQRHLLQHLFALRIVEIEFTQLVQQVLHVGRLVTARAHLVATHFFDFGATLAWFDDQHVIHRVVLQVVITLSGDVHADETLHFDDALQRDPIHEIALRQIATLLNHSHFG